MTLAENDQKYMALIERIGGVLIQSVSSPEAGPLDAVMCASDVAADVIMSLPYDQRMAACDLLIARLGNTLDRRCAKEVS